jgi:hypothetical protein
MKGGMFIQGPSHRKEVKQILSVTHENSNALGRKEKITVI